MHTRMHTHLRMSNSIKGFKKSFLKDFKKAQQNHQNYVVFPEAGTCTYLSEGCPPGCQNLFCLHAQSVCKIPEASWIWPSPCWLLHPNWCVLINTSASLFLTLWPPLPSWFLWKAEAKLSTLWRILLRFTSPANILLGWFGES